MVFASVKIKSWVRPCMGVQASEDFNTETLLIATGLGVIRLSVGLINKEQETLLKQREKRPSATMHCSLASILSVTVLQ